MLELACGTGRFAVPLARAGVQVTGLDKSAIMLSYARAKARDLGIDFVAVEGDMSDFDLKGRQFGLIFIAGNSLMHLHTVDALLNCFDAVTRHLVAGGALAFDVLNASLSLLARDNGDRQFVGNFTHQRLGELRLEQTSDYDAASQINRATGYWSASDRADFFVFSLHQRQIFPQELPLLTTLGRLRLAERYGDFDRSLFESRSHRQVCVCEPVCEQGRIHK